MKYRYVLAESNCDNLINAEGVTEMKKSTLFAKLPDFVATPDGMTIDREGNLILACPNYADRTMPGCILKIDKDKNIKNGSTFLFMKKQDLRLPWALHLVPMGIYISATIRAGQEILSL